MALTKLQFRPGINREDTEYTNEGGWVACDRVRFRQGFPEQIGGWARKSDRSFLGTCRSLHAFTALDGSRYLGVGTHLKYYLEEGGSFADITPLRKISEPGSVLFNAAASALNGHLDETSRSIPIANGAPFPDSGVIKVNNEIIWYGSREGNVLHDCIRGYYGTTPSTHLSEDHVLCSTLRVTCVAHGAVEKDFVTFKGATTLGGNLTPEILNQEYQIRRVVDPTTFYVEARMPNDLSVVTVDGKIQPELAFASASDAGTGGGAVYGEFQINVGLDTTVTGTGWGAGSWSRGAWGSGATTAVVSGILRLWSQDNYGEDLLINVRDGGIYYWDRTSSTASRAVPLHTLPGADGTTPTIAKQIMVSDRDRHVIVFGCDSEAEPGVQDPLLIRFSHQESLTTWASEPTNTAGELRIGSGNEIVRAVETKIQTLVFTDTALYTIQYLGPPYVFGLNRVSVGITIIGPGAVRAVDDHAYWMGLEDFYVYNGQVQKLPCPLKSYVFDDFNDLQSEKVRCSVNSAHNEVWWFYPSADSSEIDRYVLYNYVENTWAYGTLARTAWLDRGLNDYPIASGTDGYLYYHEFGLNDGSTQPPSPLNSFLESGDMDLGDGERFAFIRRVLPDVSFGASSADSPKISMILKARNSAGGEFTGQDGSTVIKSASAQVEQFTDQIHLRLRGRAFRLRLECNDSGVFWRLGTPRVDVRADGGR